MDKPVAKNLRIIIQDVESGQELERLEGDICVIAVAHTIKKAEGDMVKSGENSPEPERSKSQIILNGMDFQVRQLHTEMAQAIIRLTEPKPEAPLVGKINES